MPALTINLEELQGEPFWMLEGTLCSNPTFSPDSAAYSSSETNPNPAPLHTTPPGKIFLQWNRIKFTPCFPKQLSEHVPFGGTKPKSSNKRLLPHVPQMVLTEEVQKIITFQKSSRGPEKVPFFWKYNKNSLGS